MADTKISGLTAASAAAGANEFPINEAGTTKKVTGTQIAAMVQAANAATDAQTRAQSLSTVFVTPANLAGLASFKATLSANQTGIADSTYTKIQFDTEAWDVGACYDNATNYRWTPPAGKVALTVAAHTTGTISAGSLCCAQIYKNGAIFAQATPNHAVIANDNRSSVTATDNANGTDYYEAYVYIDVSASTGMIGNSSFLSYFTGWQI